MGGRVSVIGLGAMGLPMALRLVGAGWHVTGWNRSPGPRDVLATGGGHPVADAAAAVEPIVLSILPDVTQLREALMGGLLDGIEAGRSARDDLGTVHLVVMSTTGPRVVRDLDAELRPHGIRVVDAPVSGGDRGAQDGTLSIMVGGADDDVDAVWDVFAPLGRLVERMGGLGAGSMAKLCNQIVVAGNLTATAEALTVAEAAGLDLPTMVRLFGNGLARSGVLELKAEKWLSGEYSVGGNARNQLKDLRYLSDEVAELGVSAPVAALLTGLFDEVVTAGWGDEDHAVVMELLRGDRSVRGR
jgi:2-hydroxy-3-oxopropionate reductase